jgi:hypothetical protein
MVQNRPMHPPPSFGAQRRPTPAGPRFLADRHTAASAADVSIALLVASAPAIFLGIAVARFGFDNLSVRALAALTLYVNFMVVLRDLRYGLALFIVAAGLSPRMPGFYNNLRVEDLVFALVFSVWVMKSLQHGRIPLVHSPLVLPFILLTLMSAISTLWGGSLGLIPDQKYSVFLQAKRIEYFLIFWIVATTVRNEAWLRLLFILFIVSGALAGLYGLGTASSDNYIMVADRRVNGPDGENYNTLSGYLVVCIGAGLAAVSGFRGSRMRLLLFGSVGAMTLALLMSYSREGYVMLVGTLMLFGFTRHRLLLFGAAAALAAAVLVAPPVRNNVSDTIQQIQEAPHADTGGNSLAARYDAWDWRWNGWFLKQPLIGSGVGSVPLSVDNEYLLRACEVGVVGWVLFMWFLAAIGRQIRRCWQTPGIPHILALGAAAGFIGLLIQGMVGASFSTIRTMEPFCYLLGLLSASLVICRPTQRGVAARPAVSAQPGTNGAVIRPIGAGPRTTSR